MDYYPCKLYYLIILLVCLIPAGVQSQDRDVQYGLEFASHEVSKDHRTSLDLNPEQPFHFDKNFEVKFDLSFRRLSNAYGYILRTIANDTLNIDLLSSPSHNEFYDLNLIINNTLTSIHFDFTEVDLKAREWTELILGFSLKDNKISLSWNGQRKVADFPMSQLRTFRFYFGANDFGRFNTKDVPPIAIRDIEILKLNKIAQKWPLRSHRTTDVYDSVSQLRASVRNAVWSIDKHTRWVHRKELVIEKYPSVAFDGEAGLLYISDKSSLTTVDIGSGKTNKIENLSGNTVYTDANQLIYIAETRTLVNYDLRKSILSPFDPGEHRWKNTDTIYIEPDYWHHNKFYNRFDSSLYVFGGYGHFSYKNAFFRYDTSLEKWLPVATTGSIPPRYLGASGLTPENDKVLIFGGYGSTSGKQELFPQSFYDLHAFDLNTHSVEKIWELPATHAQGDLVFANSMVINKKDSCFYVLGFPKNKYRSHMRLRQYGLSSPEFAVLADSIPFQFHDEDAFSDLFLSDATGELIAVTAHEENDHFNVNVYSINYPPLNPDDVWQVVEPKDTHAKLYYILFSLGCGILIYLYARTKKKNIKTTEQIAQRDKVDSSGHKVIPGSLVEEKITSSINLFGGFQVFNRTGGDISGQFTMTLKELFVLVLLHSIKFEKGISSLELQEHLWPDKDETSARNNRNVNIKKLRTLLSEIGEITITNTNSYLRLTLGNDVHCDYQTVSRILNNVASAKAIESENIKLMLAQIKRGSLLPNLQAAWLDNFKSDISNRIIDVLLEYSEGLDANKDDKMLIEIADSIFKYDSINQEALVIKCSVLNKKGKYSLAKVWYEHFIKEYKSLYAENYPKTFEEVIVRPDCQISGAG